MSENVNNNWTGEVKVITNTHPEGWVANLVGVAANPPLSLMLDMLNAIAFTDVTTNQITAVLQNGVNLPILAGNSAVIISGHGAFAVRTY